MFIKISMSETTKTINRQVKRKYLCHIVSILILSEAVSRLQNFFHYAIIFLLLCTVLQNPLSPDPQRVSYIISKVTWKQWKNTYPMWASYLYDTETIGVCWEVNNLTIKCRYYKFYLVCRYTLDAFLNHMISVLIFDTSQDMSLKFWNQLHLLVYINNFKCLVQVSILQNYIKEIKNKKWIIRQ